MWASFNKRLVFSRNLPDILTGGTPVTGKPEDSYVWLKVLLGYTATCPRDLDDEEKWPILPDGITREMAGQQAPEELRIKLAKEAVDAWFTDDLIEKSLGRIQASFAEQPNKFSKLSVVYPATFSEEYSNNHVPAAIADRIKNYLSDRMPNRRLPLEVSVQEKEVFVVAKTSRGVPKHSHPVTEREKRYFWGIHRIAGQPFVRGEVDDKNTLYWLVDDGTTIGGTACNHLSHIIGLGGTIGAVTCLTRRYDGAEVLKAQPESIQFLAAAMRENFLDCQRKLGFEIFEMEEKEDAPRLMGNNRSLGVQLGSIGIDLWLSGGYWDKPFHPKKVAQETTATNQELLIMGSYFMNPEHEHLWELLDKALKAVGSSVQDATDSYPVKLAHAKPGHIEEFQDLVNFAVVNSRQAVTGKELEKNGEVPGYGSLGVSATFWAPRFLHSLSCDDDWEVVLDR